MPIARSATGMPDTGGEIGPSRRLGQAVISYLEPLGRIVPYVGVSPDQKSGAVEISALVEVKSWSASV